jgi:Dolichyl-phosphate-mannose-protein mannosyltransferase
MTHNRTWSRINDIACQPYIHLLLLVGITFVAAILRFYRLGEWSFWYDEIFTLRSIRDLSGMPVFTQRLSFVLTYFVVKTLGINEWSARLVPALIGILTIPILYFPIKNIFGTFVALLSSALLAVAPWHVYWSQNARFYTALLLFYTLALIFLYLGFEKDRVLYLILGMLFFGLALRERLFAFFLVPVVAGYLFFLWALPFHKPPGLRWRNLLILLIPAMLGAFFYVWQYIQDPSLWSANFGWVNNNPLWILSGVTFYIGIPVLCVGTLGGVILILRRSRVGLLLALAAIVPILAMIVISLVQYAANRYAFITLTSWIILAAVAVRELFIQTRGEARLLSLGLVLIMLLEPLGENVIYYQYQSGNRDDWKAAFSYVKQRKEPGDLVIASNPELGNYYLSEQMTTNIYGVNMDQLAGQGKRVWFVEDNNVGDKYPEKLKWIKEHSQLLQVDDVHVRARNFIMRVYLFDPAVRNLQLEPGTQ